MSDLRALLEWVVAETSIPSASLCVLSEGEEVFHGTAGVARLDPRVAAVEEQVYDLASLTKILATTPVAAALVDEGALALEDRVVDRLDDVDPRICVHHLLAHSSGLPAWLPLYEAYEESDWGSPAVRSGMLRTARTTALESEPGEAHRYSDLGFLTLLSLCEAATGKTFGELVHSRVLAPHSADLRWGWARAAATQVTQRRGCVQGEVDDLNCFAMGGVSSHAGLFGTARTVARLVDGFGEQVRDGGRLAQFAAYRGPGSHRLGFDSISPGYSSTGHHFPADTIGHLGFTGTSAWTSPSRRVTVVLLTNRLHPADVREPIRMVRPRVHDAVAKALGWS